MNPAGHIVVRLRVDSAEALLPLTEAEVSEYLASEDRGAFVAAYVDLAAASHEIKTALLNEYRVLGAAYEGTDGVTAYREALRENVKPGVSSCHNMTTERNDADDGWVFIACGDCPACRANALLASDPEQP